MRAGPFFLLGLCWVLPACTGTVDLPDTGFDAGDDDAADPGTDPGLDAGADPGSDPGSDPGHDAGADPGADLGTDAGEDPNDPHQICVTKINALRATKGLTPYTRWKSAETCVDGQATSDEQSGQYHQAFGQCSENAQNECLGGGASWIEGCLDSMWAEKDQADCSGCDACAGAYNPNCPNCDFYGTQHGQVCGHYVNMSAKYFSQAACGFSSLGGWSTIDFR
jgi:hypothetical protein